MVKNKTLEKTKQNQLETPYKGVVPIAQYYLSFRYKSAPTELKYTKVSLQLQESDEKGGLEGEIRFLEWDSQSQSKGLKVKINI